MNKIYDTKRMFEMYDYEICQHCEHMDTYYESDTGYTEYNCKGGNPPEDCQEAIRNMLDSQEEVFENEEEFLVNENNGNEMNLTVDLESLKKRYCWKY